MARKSWGELSPAYRARLERHGITAEKHAKGASLAAATGHGANTTHVLARVALRRPQKASRLYKRGASLGVSSTDITQSILIGGEYRTQLGLDYREYRRDLWKASDKKLKNHEMPTFQQYVRTTYGDAFWEEYDWEAFEDQEWLGYYHD